MAHLITWPNIQVAKQRLQTRLRAAKEARKRLVETQWLRNERYIYKNDAALASGLSAYIPGGSGSDTEDFDDPEYVEVAYAFKDLRYLHAELCANPPSVQTAPLSSDPEARYAARAGDQASRYIRKQYHLQEVYDLGGLDTMVYGTGISKTIWDPETGEVVAFSKKTGKLRLSGDLHAGRVSPWDFFPAPKSTGRLHLDWAFERFRITYDAFCSRWPHLKALLDQRRSSGERIVPVTNHEMGDSAAKSGLEVGLEATEGNEEIELFEYWETALPENGNLGRYAVCFEDGTIVEAPRPSPLALPEPLTLQQRKDLKRTGKAPRRRSPRAILPFHIWTDVDVPGRLWGKSFLEYAGPLQELMNNLDSALLELVKTHGIFRLLLPPGAQLEDGQIENDPARVYRLKSGASDGGTPQMIPPAGVPASMSELRGMTRAGIDDMAGVNESNFGNQSREQSSYLMQFAASQGRMIRRRLMNKAVAYIESLNEAMLRIASHHWDDEVMVEVLGEEHAFDSVALRGVDFDGGYRLQVEYAASLPLDPDLRRDTILKYLPILQAAGIPPRLIAKALQFGDFTRLRDAVDLAEDRQKEIFDEIEATGMQVEIRPHMDHENMLAWAKYYVMTAAFQGLPEEIQALINEHIDLRASAAAAERPSPTVAMGAPPAAVLPPAAALPPSAPMA